MSAWDLSLITCLGYGHLCMSRFYAECKENLALNMEDKSNAARIDRIDKILLML